MAKAKVISIFSPKGGCGKTILASNLAAALSGQKQKVLLLDFDLKAPLAIAKTLNLNPRYSLFETVSFFEKDKVSQAVIASQVKEKFTQYLPSLHFFPAVTRIRQTPHIKPKLVKELLECVKDDYDFIIIDSGSDFTDVLIELFDRSNLILMVVTPDILSVYKTEWSLDTLQTLKFPLNMIKLVLNRAESKGGVSWHEIKILLPCEIISMVPSDGKIVNLSLNKGVPAVLDSSGSKFSKAVKQLADQLISKQSLFIQHHAEQRIRTKEDGLLGESKDSFWQQQGLTEPVVSRDDEGAADEIVTLKRNIHHKLIGELDLEHLSADTFRMDIDKRIKLREKVERVITNLLPAETGKFTSSSEVRRKLVKEIADEALGFGPLEDLIKDSEITEIMVNNKDQIYIEKQGKIELTPKSFISRGQLRTTIERIIAPLGRRLDESTPMVDARLPDGSRVNAIIPPLSLTGPTLTIRKFSKHRLFLEDLVNNNSLSLQMADFLRVCVKMRKNMIVSGGTDSGKTTFLNSLSECIPDGERVVTIEDAAELKLNHKHWIRLESRPPNIEGKGEVAIKDLFRNSLRMRPDRIIVGEVRGREALDMLQAMNTGHDGSLSTIHSNSTKDVLVRLDSLILMSGIELPLRAIRENVASAIDVIVHTEKLPDGSRKVVQITEICGMLDETNVEMKDIFLFKKQGLDEKGAVLGSFIALGYIPSFYEEIKAKGFSLSADIFSPTR